MQLKANGIILRDQKIEEDRLLRILTDRYGVITAWANGANRTRSKLSASTELLCYSGLVLFHSRDRYTVDKADLQRSFFGIRGDLDKLALASYLSELTAELAPQGEDAAPYLRLLLNTLHLLEKNGRPHAQLKALYELRLLTMAGYMPGLVGCRICGSFESDVIYFNMQGGELICGGCLGTRDPSTVQLSPGVLAAMRHIVFSEPDKLFSFTLSDEGFRQLGQVCEHFLQYQLEKTFPTLEFYHALGSQIL